MLKRIGRAIFSIFAGGLLLLWITLIAFWIRSYWRGDVIIHSWVNESAASDSSLPRYKTRTIVLVSGQGGLCFAAREFSQLVRLPSDVSGSEWQVINNPTYPQPSMWTRNFRPSGLGFTGGAVVPSSNVRQPSSAPRRQDAISLSPTIDPFKTPESNPTETSTFSSKAFAPQSVAIKPGTTTRPSANPGNIQPMVAFQGNLTGIPRGGGAPTPPLAGVLVPPATPTLGTEKFLTYKASDVNDALQSADFTYVAIFPYWSAMAVLSLLVLVTNHRVFVWWRQGHRQRTGCCAACGYDLRATPDCCPECGTAPVAAGEQHA